MKSLTHYKDAFVSRTTNLLMQHKSIKLNRHIVVFESDDWGSVRMPSLQVLDDLLKKGVRVGSPSTYDRLDTLASNDDLIMLMDVLSSIKDSNGNPAKITFNCVMANPDFNKIKESGYQQYFFEPFTETLKRYPNHDKSFDLWKEGIKQKMIQPQFHGREHLNVQRWMKMLKDGVEDYLVGLDYGTFSIKDKCDRRVLPAFDIDSEQEKTVVKQSIEEGLQMFKNLFGFESKSMIAPCYIWDTFVEDVASKNGVQIIQGGYQQHHSVSFEQKQTAHYLGQTNTNGQVYLTRNCMFEPSQVKKYNGDYCLKQIEGHFKVGRPAIVSCHRLNFIGELVPKNRENNLKDLKKMLENLLQHYPDTVFMSSDELGLLYLKNIAVFK